MTSHVAEPTDPHDAHSLAAPDAVLAEQHVRRDARGRQLDRQTDTDHEEVGIAPAIVDGMNICASKLVTFEDSYVATQYRRNNCRNE